MKKDNQNLSLFDTGGGSINGDAPEFPSGESGSIPTPPLQTFSPKQLTVRKITHATAKRIWTEFHYLKRDVPGMSLELGVFSPDNQLVGAVGFSQWMPGKTAHPDKWELRRMWLGPSCGRNSESRILSIAAKMVKKLCPHVKMLVSYSDRSIGHEGTIYKAAGWRFDCLAGLAHKEGDDWCPYGKGQVFSQGDLTVQKKRWVLPL